MNRPFVVGITGTIASGKSLIGNILVERGFDVIDTDKVVHELMETDDLKQAISQHFGSTVIDSGGNIDRAKLGALVFRDKAARAGLEKIVHPRTIAETDKRVHESKSNIVFVLVPLLFEVGMRQRYDRVWTVITDEPILRQRLKTRNNLSDSEITARLGAQLSQQEKALRADAIIDNSGTISDTTRQIDSLLAEIQHKPNGRASE